MNDSGAANIGEQPEMPQDVTFRTAFLVFVTKDGETAATNDPSLFADSVSVEKMAHPDEIDAACAAIRTDIAAQKTAAMVQGLMMQAARAAQEAQMNAAILNQTGLKVK